MLKIRDVSKIFINKIWVNFYLGFLLFFVAACAKSGAPHVQELIKAGQPTIQGSKDIRLTTPTPVYVLNGECDSNAYGLQYSHNQSTWMDVPGDCKKGKFRLQLIIEGTIDVYLRAKSKTSFSPTTKVSIRLVLPPTSPFFSFASSGVTPRTQRSRPTMQNTMSSLMTGEPMTGAGIELDSQIIGVIYGN
jgi:hypothetical protein